MFPCFVEKCQTLSAFVLHNHWLDLQETFKGWSAPCQLVRTVSNLPLSDFCGKLEIIFCSFLNSLEDKLYGKNKDCICLPWILVYIFLRGKNSIVQMLPKSGNQLKIVLDYFITACVMCYLLAEVGLLSLIKGRTNHWITAGKEASEESVGGYSPCHGKDDIWSY